jgi:hypothetical protein
MCTRELPLSDSPKEQSFLQSRESREMPQRAFLWIPFVNSCPCAQVDQSKNAQMLQHHTAGMNDGIVSFVYASMSPQYIKLTFKITDIYTQIL